MQNLGIQPESGGDSTKINCLDGSFKLYLYVSFPNRADSLALDLFEALAEYCNRQGRNNFDLYVRLSGENQNPQRWDQKFIHDQLQKKFDLDEIKKIWVCGPPVMNETFDRALGLMTDLRKDQIEIL